MIAQADLASSSTIPLGRSILSREEAVIYELIFAAAERGACCPDNIDFALAAGFNSLSMGPKLLRGLEAKGFVRADRSQRARRVMIVATGKWTAWPACHKMETPRVDRGTHDDSPLVKALVDFGFERAAAIEMTRTRKAILRLDKDIEKIGRLVKRRMNGFFAEQDALRDG